MGRIDRQLSETYAAVSSDIFKFAAALHFEPTWQQAQLLEAVQRGDQAIACRSGQGPGKTTASVIVGMWRLIRNVLSKVVVTAPTMRQCKDVWLAEARLRLAEADPWLRRFIEITNTRVTVAGCRDWCVELVTATRDENAQGYHRENMTIICEEASGIPRKMIQQFQGTLSNPNPLLLQIGNPNTRDCSFFDCFHTQRHRWTTLHWNAEETPPSRWFDPERNTKLEDEFGRESDVYRVRVLGEFPHSDPNCVMSMEEVERIADRKLIPKMVVLSSAKQFGLDFARFGGDENVLMRRSGNAIVEWEKHPHTDPNDVAARAFVMQSQAGWRDNECWYVADAGGMGQGVMKRFYEAHKQVMEFHNGSKSVDPQYDNKITEGWFSLAKKIREGRCCIPNDNMLIQQLTTRQYYLTKKGRIILETKEDYMKRGHEHSPDRADACVLAFWDSPAIMGNMAMREPATHRIGEIRR